MCHAINVETQRSPVNHRMGMSTLHLPVIASLKMYVNITCSKVFYQAGYLEVSPISLFWGNVIFEESVITIIIKSCIITENEKDCVGTVGLHSKICVCIKSNHMSSSDEQISGQNIKTSVWTTWQQTRPGWNIVSHMYLFVCFNGRNTSFSDMTSVCFAKAKQAMTIH